MKRTYSFSLVCLLLLLLMPLAIFQFSRAESAFNPPPTSPNQNMKWDFNNGDVVSWMMRMYRNGTLEALNPVYYNVSDFSYETSIFTGRFYYSVELAEMYWDVSLSQLVETGSSSEKFSLINFTTNEMIIQEKPSGPEFNLFVPKNGTNGLILDWIAQPLANYYYQNASIFIMPPSWSVDGNKITIQDNGPYTDSYIELIYYNNGTLKTGQIFQDLSFFGYGTIMYNYTRNYDLNPIDDISWGGNVGDEIYVGNFTQEFKYKITSITDINAGNTAVQEVKANTYWWNSSSKSWEYQWQETIGLANEYYPMYSPSYMPILVPKGTTGNDLYRMNVFYTYSYPELRATFGANWFRMVNSSSGGYGYYEYYPDGVLKYLITTHILLSPYDLLIYHKNATEFLGFHGFSIEPHGTNDFFITGGVEVSAPSLLLCAAMNLNPTSVSLENAYLFIDMFLNDTSNLQGIINLTISFDTGSYSNINVWWLNETANGGLGAWEQVPTTSLSPGNVQISVDHLSFFGITASILPSSFTLNDLTSPDDDGEFTLSWYESLAADNYSVYVYNAPITESNLGEATLLASGLNNLQYFITGLSNGTYYYAVLAVNEQGTVLSNSISVTVAIPPTGGGNPPPTEPPSIPFGFSFIIFLSAGILYLFLRKKRSINL